MVCKAYFEGSEARGDTFTSIPKEVLDQHDPLDSGKYSRRECRLSGGSRTHPADAALDSLKLRVRFHSIQKSNLEFTAIDNALVLSREFVIFLHEPLCLLLA